MSAIEDQLMILRDFEGNFYQPAAKGTLTNWDFKKGYYVKMLSEKTLEVEGLYPLSKQLDLQTGWMQENLKAKQRNRHGSEVNHRLICRFQAFCRL